MKAYRISCLGEDYHHQCVVFADSRVEARHKDSRDCDCAFIDLRIVRAPSFDDLSPGPVTVQEYLDRGWFWLCQYCDKAVYDNDNPVIIMNRHVCCNLACVVASRESHDPKGAHESIVSLCRELDEWLSAGNVDDLVACR